MVAFPQRSTTGKHTTRMDHDTTVTLFAGPLDGLALTTADLAALVQDYGTERFVFLTSHGVSGLYQQVGDRWVYATPHLLDTPDQPPTPPEEPA
ncbi:hypothetical protein FOF52_18935 [Thermobifida alba]|uniref:Uncharacterized protein n=1 Tax=Thermobifida alba TaxID=53522 RepID=A0ABY4L505_THEAE|nr:hypothetical protein [Thermobifida alba]UPT22767.1 hypothetical protein FOF52_18935 [Thermobifida alba]